MAVIIGMNPPALIWFRNNLRLHDNEALTKAAQNGPVIGIYFFNPDNFKPTSIGLTPMGKFRLKFILQALQNLKYNLNKLGIQLLVQTQKPHVALPAICKTYHIKQIHTQKEAGTFEQQEEKLIKNWCEQNEVSFFLYEPNLLYSLDKLPFDISNTPDVFTHFRKIVEKHMPFNKLWEFSKQITGLKVDETFYLPTLKDFGYNDFNIDANAAFKFKGGEDEALQHVKDYIWNKELITTYKETRNGLIGSEYSSKLSAWLAIGCISPRYIYKEIKQFEATRIKNTSTYWLIFELLWRDYFKLIMFKYGSKLFTVGGILNLPFEWKTDIHLFNAWANGQTGYALIDANMRELKQTGFMSNRGRQLVASFLTKNLGINWLWGAMWFEHYLIDYDVSSNYGNWNYAAGIGNDVRGFRYFNIFKQAKEYDGNGDYVRIWVPELKHTIGFNAHRTNGINGYPNPIVNLEKSAEENLRKYETSMIRLTQTRMKIHHTSSNRPIKNKLFSDEMP
jgi:deoxyribodipyrimidine photo-lyase